MNDLEAPNVTAYCLVIFSVLTAFLAVPFLVSYLSQQALPQSLPRAGQRNEWMPFVRSCFREYWRGKKTMEEGYDKFSTYGQSFLVPDITLWPHIVIPQEQCRWLLSLPTSIASHGESLLERHALKYVFPDIPSSGFRLLNHTIRRNITLDLSRKQEDMFDVIQQAVDSVLGHEHSWSQVRLSNLVEEVTRTTTFGMFLGSTLAHDKRLHTALARFTISFGVASFIIGQLTPWPLKRVVAWFTAPIVVFFRQQVDAILSPLFHSSFEAEERRRRHPKLGPDEPRDFISSAIKTILDNEQATIGDLKTSESLLTVILMTAISTTSLTLTNTLLDLLATDSSLDHYLTLRKEAESVFTSPDWANATGLLELRCTDSAIRESMRLSPIHTRGLFRTVVAEEGLTLPDGHHAPKGCMMSLPVYCIHRDERFYKEADKYMPLRFVFPDTSEQRRPCGLAATSNTFLSFSHGAHSCVGRFFAAQLLKMTIAYITMHYDMKPLGTRPANLFVSDICAPPRSIKIWVRRRKSKAEVHLKN